MKYKLLIMTFLLILISLSANVFAANSRHSMNVKIGAYELATENQNIAAFDLTFDTASTSFAVEYEYAFSQISIGSEIMIYSNDYKHTISNRSGATDSFIATFNVKKYFKVTEHFSPFLGAGMGLAFVDITGQPLSGDAAGAAYQFMLGMEYRTSNLGLYAEYKYVSAKPEYEILFSGITEDLDISGQGLFAGISVHF